MAAAARHHARALPHRVGAVALDLLDRRGLDERPLGHADLDAVADLQLHHFFGEAGH